MIIKKYTGKTEGDALEAAKKELGNGVVTMNVKTVKRKGLAGVFGARQVEVTVALEEEGDNPRSVRREGTPSRSSAASLAAGSTGNTAQPKATRGLMGENSQNIEKKLDNLENLLVKSLRQEEASREEQMLKSGNYSDDGQEDNLEGSSEKEEISEQEKFIRLLYNTMLENEVDEKYANQIIGDVDKTGKQELPIDYILANVYQKMILKFNKPTGIAPAENGPKVVLFMGPTGVGKTTTIAKIASSYVIDYKKNVALLTADTYRIAAAEQLHTYANILEVPFQVVYTPEEAVSAIKNYKDFDYIFMDTSGHSHQNEERLDSMKKLIETVGAEAEYQAFLVLSATTKYRDLLKIATSYREISEYQLVFTKLDETSSLGNLLNVKMQVGAEIAFVTYGQNVPDDIELFNPQKAVKQLLSTRRG